MRRCVLFAALVFVVTATPCLRAESCEALKALASPTVKVDLAKTTPAGGLSLPSGSQKFSQLQAFCRVAVTLKPTSDSDIHAEIWMPSAGWNSKLMAVGSGGWGGSIAYDAMAQALARGYATAATD